MLRTKIEYFKVVRRQVGIGIGGHLVGGWGYTPLCVIFYEVTEIPY